MKVEYGELKRLAGSGVVIFLLIPSVVMTWQHRQEAKRREMKCVNKLFNVT